MSNIDVDVEEVERRLAFVMSELREIQDATYAIVRAAKPAGLEDHMARWTEGRFGAFIQQARDAVWTARCTVGLVPENKDEQ
jgi:hypothetical protein